MCRHLGENPPLVPPNWPGRRAFLRSAGLAGAGVAALGALSADPASAAAAASAAKETAIASAGRLGAWRPDTESLQFTLAVMPDTQFLYWGTQGSVNPAPQIESFGYVINNSGSQDGKSNIVFMAHLGDLTEDADTSSFGYATLIQSTGITQLALPWALGGYEYGGVINQIFHGWVGDVRIVNRPLTPSEFMTSRRRR
jgi:hypothetical protein